MRISTSQFQKASINAILERQVELSKVQNQLATGKRVMSPSDDPVAATRVHNISGAIAKTNQYQSNASFVSNRLELQDSILGEFVNNLQRISELSIQANNDHLTQLDRSTIAKEVQVRLDALVSLGNTQDANGEFIFAGGKVTTKPIAYNGTAYTYQGDDTTRSLEVGAGVFIQQTDAGSDVFFDIPNGSRTNGYLSDISPANTGTGSINSVVVSNAAAITKHKYQIDYNGANFVVTDTTTGAGVATVPPAPGPGTTFTFDGLDVNINGAPAALDQFTLEPSTSEDLYTTVKRLADAMNTPIATPADDVQVKNTLRKSIEQMQNAVDHVLLVRAGIGGRLNSTDSQGGINEDVIFNLEKVRSNLEDLDYAEASSDLNLKLAGMQAAQQVYVKAQSLSLFNQLS